MKNKANKVIKIILNIILWVFILLAAIITIISLSTKENGIANIAGYIPFSIQSPSMEPEIYTGDLIITKKCNPKELKVGDIISFFAIEEDTVIVKTHRIEEVKNDGVMLSFVTKGDNNLRIDEQEVAPGDIVSVYTGTKIPKFGYVLDFLKSQVGFFVCIIIPLFIFFLYQLYRFIVVIVQMKQEEAIRNNKK